MTRPTSADCRTCGACCVGGYDDDHGFADCSESDVKRMSRHARSRLHVGSVGPIDRDRLDCYSTPALMTEDFGKVCGFLRGTPGRRVSCGIYETRPDVCRKFTPGNKDCIRARWEIGL